MKADSTAELNLRVPCSGWSAVRRFLKRRISAPSEWLATRELVPKDGAPPEHWTLLLPRAIVATFYLRSFFAAVRK